LRFTKTRLYFVSDIHGSNLCFKKFLNAEKFYGAKVLILGGDVTGKTLVPMVRTGGAALKVNEGGVELLLESHSEIEKVKRRISDGGGYPCVVDAKGLEDLEARPMRLSTLFRELAEERLESWIRLADKKLEGTGVKCFVSPGNDDPLEIDAVLGSGKHVVNPEGRVMTIDGEHEMVTLGYTNRTPWNSPRELDEEVLLGKIDRMSEEVENLETAVFNLHVPPIDTPIDQAPKLDRNLKPVVSGGSPVMVSAGSTAVRTSIERYQPLLGLHGHIHESRGMARIGRTMCFNPGSEYGEGILNGVLCEIEGGVIRSHLLTSG